MICVKLTRQALLTSERFLLECCLFLSRNSHTLRILSEYQFCATPKSLILVSIDG